MYANSTCCKWAIPVGTQIENAQFLERFFQNVRTMHLVSPTMRTFFCPPPGLCVALSSEPTFDAARSEKSSFCSKIFRFPPPAQQNAQAIQ